MRKIGVITVDRSDYGLLKPLLGKIAADESLEMRLIASGSHFSEDFGSTIRDIETDGFTVHDRVEAPPSSDAPADIARAMGRQVAGFADSFRRARPDILVVLGDRYEMAAAVIAALPFNIPVAHLHGGELTLGALDDALRHAITKMSHLHFTAMTVYAQRVRQMGEESWRIQVSGALGLDAIAMTPLVDRKTLEERIGIKLDPAPLVVTYHPVTREFQDAASQTDALVRALETVSRPIIVTRPNADTHYRVVAGRMQRFAEKNRHVRFIKNLGTQHYFSLMNMAAAMVGNSSSGIIEAPSFGLPVVNIGSRQEGRLRARNVVDTGYTPDEILNGLRKALSPDFSASLKNKENPYGDGRAAERIIARLKEVSLDTRLIHKRFIDLNGLNPTGQNASSVGRKEAAQHV